MSHTSDWSSGLWGLINWFRIILGLTLFPLRDDDVVVFLVGPSGSGKSTFVRAATKARPVDAEKILQSTTRKVQAFRCELPLEVNLGVKERKNIVFVDTPSFGIDSKGDARAERELSTWLKGSKSKSTLFGTIYMHRIEGNPANDPVQPHLDKFASTFPADFRAFPMRVHCVFSRQDNITETKMDYHKERLQEQVNMLRSKRGNLMWKASIHDDLFMGDDCGEAWKAIQVLFSSAGAPPLVQGA